MPLKNSHFSLFVRRVDGGSADADLIAPISARKFPTYTVLLVFVNILLISSLNINSGVPMLKKGHRAWQDATRFTHTAALYDIHFAERRYRKSLWLWNNAIIINQWTVHEHTYAVGPTITIIVSRRALNLMLI